MLHSELFIYCWFFFYIKIYCCVFYYYKNLLVDFAFDILLEFLSKKYVNTFSVSTPVLELTILPIAGRAGATMLIVVMNNPTV